MSDVPKNAAATAVVLSCHGTVERVGDIPAFVQNIRRGRPAPQEVIDEVSHRFELIGGSPMMRITHAQAAALEARLGLPVRAAARLWDPYPKDVLAKLQAEEVTHVVSLPLAPQSTHVYNAAVEKAAADLGMTVTSAGSWGEEPKLVAAFCEAIVEAHSQCAGPAPQQLAILLTAHSLPKAIVDRGDPYERDFRVMADTVRAALATHGLGEHPCRVAFQSQGMGGGDWLGPDLTEAFAALRTDGVERVLVAPIGFLAEHVETLYDIDIEAQKLAKDAGLKQLVRMPALNCRPAFIDALEQVARATLA